MSARDRCRVALSESISGVVLEYWDEAHRLGHEAGHKEGYETGEKNGRAEGAKAEHDATMEDAIAAATCAVQQYEPVIPRDLPHVEDSMRNTMTRRYRARTTPKPAKVTVRMSKGLGAQELRLLGELFQGTHVTQTYGDIENAWGGVPLSGTARPRFPNSAVRACHKEGRITARCYKPGSLLLTIQGRKVYLDNLPIVEPEVEAT